MTLQTNEPAVAPVTDGVTVTIDGFEITVPKGTLVIRAAELLGLQIPRFCDHPLLEPAGACRQCLVEVTGQVKPLASCTTTCTEGMVVRTQLTSPVAEKAQRGVMELLLINHPLDCPMCDKGGECPLQNQAMSNGQGDTRFTDHKRTFAKPVAISTEVLLDRERCISCTRCTRFSEQIAGDPFIEFFERGPDQFIGTAEGKPFDSYFSGNTVQICPVGALTGAAYRFRSRPFDLVSTPSICEHCASGCRQRTDSRRGQVTRRLAGNDPEVNEEWNCDKGRWAFTYATEPDRLVTPLVRNESGVLAPASWPEALGAAAAGLAAARGRAGVLTGGRLTIEDAYAYAKFARIALASNDIDLRARPHSLEEAQFLAAHVAGREVTVSYAGLERAPAVLLAGFEPEDECPIVFLRLRKAARATGTAVYSLAPFASSGLAKMGGKLLPTVPGSEATTLIRLAAGQRLTEAEQAAAQALAGDGAGPDFQADHKPGSGQRVQRGLLVRQVTGVDTGDEQGIEVARRRRGEHLAGVPALPRGHRGNPPQPGHLRPGLRIGNRPAEWQQARQCARVDRPALPRPAGDPGEPGAGRRGQRGHRGQRTGHLGQPLARQDHRAVGGQGLRGSLLGLGQPLPGGQPDERGGLAAGDGRQQRATHLGQPAAGERGERVDRPPGGARLAQPQEDDRAFVLGLEPGQQHCRRPFQAGVTDRHLLPGHVRGQELGFLGRVRAGPQVDVVAGQCDPGELGIAVGVFQGEPAACEHPSPAARLH